MSFMLRGKKSKPFLQRNRSKKRLQAGVREDGDERQTDSTSFVSFRTKATTTMSARTANKVTGTKEESPFYMEEEEELSYHGDYEKDDDDDDDGDMSYDEDCEELEDRKPKAKDSMQVQGQDQDQDSEEESDEEESSTEESQDNYTGSRKKVKLSLSTTRSEAISRRPSSKKTAAKVSSPLPVSTTQSTGSPPVLSKASGKSSGVSSSPRPRPRPRPRPGRASFGQMKFDSLATLGSVDDIAMMSTPVRNSRRRRIGITTDGSISTMTAFRDTRKPPPAAPLRDAPVLEVSFVANMHTPENYRPTSQESTTSFQNTSITTPRTFSPIEFPVDEHEEEDEHEYDAKMPALLDSDRVPAVPRTGPGMEQEATSFAAGAPTIFDLDRSTKELKNPNSPKPSLAYDVVRLLDSNNPSLGTEAVSSPSPWVVPRKIKHPPKKRPYTYVTRPKAKKPPRNMLFDVSVARDSCYDDGSWREVQQETNVKPHRSTMQRELLHLNAQVGVSSSRSLRPKVPMPSAPHRKNRVKLKSWKAPAASCPPSAKKTPRKFTTFYYPKKKRKKASYIPKATKKANENNHPRQRKGKELVKLNEGFLIPDYEAVAPVLQKLGFQSRNGRFYLPHHSLVQPEEDVTFCSSSERLRESLCRYGVPTSTIVLTEEEREDTLLPWVRYSIAVPFLEEPTECPALVPMLAREAQKLMKHLGARTNDKYIWYLDDVRYDAWQDLENYLTHAGIAGLVDMADKNNKAGCPVSRVDVIRLAVYLAQNQYVDLL
jgi:hypothetical protein